MTVAREINKNLKIMPLNVQTWSAFEALFGEKGAHGGCWCMFWRMQRGEFMKMSEEEHKAAMQEMVYAGNVPGILLMDGNDAVGWCAVGPKEDFYPLVHSRSLKAVDDQPVWSIVCFFVAKENRRKGIMTQLIRGALDYAHQHGASIVEAYPTDTGKNAGKKLTGYHGYMGIASVFKALGFVEVGKGSGTQLIFRHSQNK